MSCILLHKMSAVFTEWLIGDEPCGYDAMNPITDDAENHVPDDDDQYYYGDDYFG